MLSPAEIREHLAGAWSVMNGRSDGLRRLDLSLAGFWRSFAAIVLVLPLSLLVSASTARIGADPLDPRAPSLLVESAAVLVDWIAFPLVFAVLAKSLGLASRFVPFIIARNWAAVIVAFFYAIGSLPHLLGFISDEAAGIVLLVVFGIALRFAYLVARTALAVPAGVAAPVVAVEVLLSLVTGLALARM